MNQNVNEEIKKNKNFEANLSNINQKITELSKNLDVQSEKIKIIQKFETILTTQTIPGISLQIK